MNDRKRLSGTAIALILSLVANALLIGFLLGGQLGERDRERRGPRGGAEHMIARGIQSIVPDEDRAELRAAFRNAFRSARGQWHEKRSARDDLIAALKATPFERAAVDQAFLDMRTADSALNETFQTVLADQIAALSDEQRGELVDWLVQRVRSRQENPLTVVHALAKIELGDLKRWCFCASGASQRHQESKCKQG